MEPNGLSISLLEGELKAAWVRRGSVKGTWACPDAVSELTTLPAYLRQAAAGTRCDGGQVSVVLAHPLLSSQVIEVPPGKGRTLQRLQERQVQRLKAFPGDAVWSMQPALSVHRRNVAMLHYCPRFLLYQLARGCRGAGMHLVRVVPTTSVLVMHLKELPLAKGEVVLLAAETGPNTSVVVGGSDGRICLARVFRGNWKTEPERVTVDLLRSIGFAEQQSGLKVSGVWVFGEGVEGRLEAMASALKLPVKLSPVAASPTYWAEQLGRLPEKGDANLVSLELREAPQRKRMLTVTGVLVFLLLLGSVGLSGWMEWMRRTEVAEVALLEAQIAQLERTRVELEESHRHLEAMKELVRVVSEERPAPLPDWFMGYLGSVVPDELYLTQVRLQQTNALWTLRMEGALRPGAGGVLTNSLPVLTNSLVTGPFQVTLREAPLVEEKEAPRPGLFRLPSDVPMAREEVVVTDPNRFVLEGVMR